MTKVRMTNEDEDRFSQESWWATEPRWVLDVLSRQLIAASAIWPELAEWKIIRVPPLMPEPPNRQSDAGEGK